MPRLIFEPTTPVFDRAKTIHASDRAATVIGATDFINMNYELQGVLSFSVWIRTTQSSIRTNLLFKFVLLDLLLINDGVST
jgi:hypothetical protein